MVGMKSALSSMIRGSSQSSGRVGIRLSMEFFRSE